MKSASDLALRIEACKKCGNLPKLKTILQVGKSKILILGESPAKDGWIVSGRAFYNRENKLQASGKVLNRLLSLCGLTIDDVSFTETCKCIIADRNTLDRCCENCKPFLLMQLGEIDCDIILTMGKYPTQVLLNKSIKKLGDVVGKKHYIKLGDKQRVVIPIYHTSPINPLGYKGNEKVFKELLCNI